MKPIKYFDRRRKKSWQILLGIIAFLSFAIGGFAVNQLRITTSNNSPIVSQRNNSCGSLSSGITDNAIATHYGKDIYPWTNQIKWNCVYNIKDFPGNNINKRFNAARDAAAANGGGVVYFPAGTYNFTDSIKLKNGVIIRGETPKVKNAKSNSFLPTTKLVFPKYEPQLSGSGTPNNTAFKNISTNTPDRDSNIGLINLDINRAAINIKADLDNGKNQNIIIFGVRSNNVAEPDPEVPDINFQESWQRLSYRFAANIIVNGYANVLISNNRLNDRITDNYNQPGYKVKSRDKKSIITYENDEVTFSYTNHYGMIINRDKASGFKLAATPKTEPGLFRQGIVVRDNWIYHTMRVGIMAAGDGLIIKDNQIKDKENKQYWIDPTGKRETTGAVTLENRGIDWSGWNVLVEGNNYEVYRHKIGNTNYLSVDGEGILVQECCGGTKVNGAVIKNNQGNAYIGLYKVRDIRNVRIIDNQLTSNIFVMADTNSKPYSMENVRVENNNVAGKITMKASLGGGGNLIENNIGKGKSVIEYSCGITVKNNSGFEVRNCS